MKKYELKNIATPIVVLFIICAGIALILAATNLFTKNEIQKQSELSSVSSRQEVLSLANDFKEETFEGATYYRGIDTEGKTVGLVFVTSARGYGGPIEVMTGITVDCNISGVNILSQNETPGLGANATKDSFKNQFLKKAPQSGFSVGKNKALDDNEIEALTGATISSKAVTAAVNEALNLFNDIKNGGDF